MQTQIQCPRCQNPFVTEVFQIIDVGLQPELKQLLLSGALNVASCSNCGAATQIASPLLFHDPEHELFMVYVPMELNLNQQDRQQLIGKLVQEAMSQLPAEQQRAYMLQPQEILSLQTFMEKVLETEGITKEMLERQRQQMELLQTLVAADKDVVDSLLVERADEIDETFFAMLQSSITMMEQNQQEQESLKLINLRARLLRETEVGRRIEKQQQALHAFRREVKENQEQVTPQLLLKHILLNLNDEAVTAGLMSVGQAALNYEFFTRLTEEIEKREKAGEADVAQKLTDIRQQLLDAQEKMRQESQRLLNNATQVIDSIMAAEDKEAAIQQNGGKIDETFMYVLSMKIAEAEQDGRQAEAIALRDIQTLILDKIDAQAPPEIRQINRWLRIESEEELRQEIEQNKESLTPDMLRVIDMILVELEEANEQALAQRLQRVRQIASSLAVSP